MRIFRITFLNYEIIIKRSCLIHRNRQIYCGPAQAGPQYSISPHHLLTVNCTKVDALLVPVVALQRTKKVNGPLARLQAFCWCVRAPVEPKVYFMES